MLHQSDINPYLELLGKEENPVWSFLKYIFSWNPESPLTFMNLFFWGFFAVVLLGYSMVYRANLARTLFLLLVSFFFYFKTSGFFIILLFFTIINDYCLGLGIAGANRSLNNAQDTNDEEAARKAKFKKKFLLTISIVCNLTLLGYFKYAYFFHESFNQVTGNSIPFFNHYAEFSNHFFGTEFRLDKLILPVGISFFTFQSISYIVDLYREKVQPVKNILEYGFFVCFFPHLVAGPIVKAHEFLWQINLPYKLTRFDFGMALFWIINGFAKKVLADYVGVNFVDRIFEHPGYYSGVEVILGVFGYSMQIYADFSGYTDIAIGVALLLGFRLKTNFNSPYKALSTSEFWQRWHISLSSWLKEYLYIPLGGNKKGTIGSYLCISLIAIVVILLTGKIWLLFIFGAVAVLLFVLTYFFDGFKNVLNTNINLLVTMLLGGLWHGSSWMFIIWGGLNGFGLIIHKTWQKLTAIPRGSKNYIRIYYIVLTVLVFLAFSRLWFNNGLIGSLFNYLGQEYGEETGRILLTIYRIVLTLLWGALTMYKLYRFAQQSRVWNFIYKAIALLVTLSFISFTRIWFRSENLEIVGSVFDRIGNHLGFELTGQVLLGYKNVLLVLLIAYLIHWIPERFKTMYRHTFAKMPVPAMAVTIILAVFLLYQAMSAEMQPFIYFQF